jgi:hypothetical protein
MANPDEITTAAESPTVLIDYQKSAAAEGRTALFWLIVAIVGLTIFEYVFIAEHLRQNRPFVLGPGLVIACIAFEILLASFGFYFVILHLRSSKVFRCRLDTEHLVCESPFRVFHDSFVLPIVEIASITKTRREDMLSYNYTLWDRTGRRDRLWHNYGNPVESIMMEIRRLRPDLPEPEIDAS